MKRFFRNIPWRNILIIGLVAVLGIGAVVGITSIVKEDMKEISATAFKRGALNDQGFYIESDQSIYTKDLIECQGLEIEPDFETIGTYQVYYYDFNKQFIGKTDKINSQTDGVYVKHNDFPFAKYCRIVITPDPAKDEDGYVIEDYAIKFYEVAGIAAKYKISVNKNQNFTSENLFVSNDDYKDKSILFDSSTFTYSFADNPGYSTSGAIDVSEFVQFMFIYDNDVDSGVFTWIILDANGTPLACENELGSTNSVIYTLPAGSATMYVTYKNGSEFGLYAV